MSACAGKINCEIYRKKKYCRKAEAAEEDRECKGCKYAYINSFAVSSGEALCTLSGKPMQQDDFCSYGEPKEG